MTLIELCELYWWSINDSSTNPLLITKAMITLFINAALKELSHEIIYRKSSTITPAVYTATVTLPTDILKIERVTWAGNEILPMYDIQLAEGLNATADEIEESDAEYVTTVTNYRPSDKTTLVLYPTPESADLGPCVVQYRAYLPELSLDTDEPTLVPEQYHKDIVLVFVRAQHALKLGRYSEYQFLLRLWEDIKKEVGGAEDADVEPLMDDSPGTFNW